MRERTVDEIEPEYGAVRHPPVVDRFTGSQDRISQRHEVPNGGTRPKILKVRSNSIILTAFREVFELIFGQINLRVQFLNVSVVELSRDGLIDIEDWGVLPERYFLLH